MAKSSTVIRDLRKLQEEWFKDDSPMAARIDAAIKEIREYEWENGFLGKELHELNKKLAGELSG
jgi:hypothetical protein